MFKQFLLQFSEAEADATYCGCIVGYGKLQVLAPCADLSRRGGKPNTFCCENRPGIALAEGAKHLQLADGPAIAGFAQFGHCVDVQFGDHIIFAQVLLCIGLKFGCKLVYLPGFDSHAGCHFVASEIN